MRNKLISILTAGVMTGIGLSAHAGSSALFSLACNNQALVGEWNLDAHGYIEIVQGVPWPLVIGTGLPVQATGKAVYRVLPDGTGQIRGFTTDVDGGIPELEVPFEGTYSLETRVIGGTPVCVGDIKLLSEHAPDRGGPHHHCFQVMPSRLFEEFKYISYPCPPGYITGSSFEAIMGTSRRDK